MVRVGVSANQVSVKRVSAKRRDWTATHTCTCFARY